jgi:hypothetical protein
VRAIAESPSDEQETHYLEWKGPLTLVGKDAAGRAAVAKAVLGFANRDPAEASRAFGGCAYLLAGVSPGDLCGVEVVDAAKLEAQVATYAGRTIGWRADDVAMKERSVLVVTVEPPQWGDPIHPVRKTFNSSDTRGPVLQEGTAFVRHQASTERATAADLDMLSRRAARRPGDQLEIDLRPAPGTALHRLEVETESIERYIARVQSPHLSSLPVEPRAAAALAPYGQNALSRLAGPRFGRGIPHRGTVSRSSWRSCREAAPNAAKRAARTRDPARCRSSPARGGQQHRHHVYEGPGGGQAGTGPVGHRVAR